MAAKYPKRGSMEDGVWKSDYHHAEPTGNNMAWFLSTHYPNVPVTGNKGPRYSDGHSLGWDFPATYVNGASVPYNSVKR